MFCGIQMTGGALFDNDAPARAVGVGDGSDAAFHPDQQTQAGAEIRNGEIDGLGAFRGDGHGGKDEVDLAGFQSWYQTVEREADDFDRPMETFSDGISKVHGNADRPPIFVAHFKRGIGEFHADAERRRGRQTMQTEANAAEEGEKARGEAKERFEAARHRASLGLPRRFPRRHLGGLRTILKIVECGSPNPSLKLPNP